MRNGIIVILSVVLCAAAFLTRPTEDDFEALVRRQDEPDRRSMPERTLRKGARTDRAERTERSLARAEMIDRLLWVEVRRDGKTLYAGLFSHWWDSRGRMQRA